jgi:hypothetical protein
MDKRLIMLGSVLDIVVLPISIRYFLLIKPRYRLITSKSAYKQVQCFV